MPRQHSRALGPSPRRISLLVLVACLCLSAASLLLPSIPSYDGWSWLLWGKEVVHLDLSTTDGPSWKPFPVLFTAVFAPVGAIAPSLWMVVARAGGLLALTLAFRVARRLVGPALPGLGAGVIAAVGVATAPGFFRMMGLGTSEGLLMALTLLALDRHLAGSHRAAFGSGVLVGLLRPDAWPLLLAYALWLIVRDRSSWRSVAGLIAVIPTLWLLPEWWGSGDPLGSMHRAELPGRTTYLSYVHPVGQAFHDAWHCVRPAVSVGVALALGLELARLPRRRPQAEILGPLAAAVAWLALVVLMVARGFAGAPRYFMGAAAVLSVLGGVGWGRLGAVATGRGRAVASVTAALVALAGIGVLAANELAALPGQRREARSIRASAREGKALPTVIARAGGPGRVLACGPPMTLPAIRPIVAWYLDVAQRDVATRPRRQGFVIQLRHRASHRYGPRPPANARLVASAGSWRIVSSPCVSRPGHFADM